MSRLALVLAALLAAPVLAGCIEPGATLDPAAVPDSLVGAGFDTSRGWSTPLSPALYDVLPSVKARVASFDGVEMALGIFLPDIDGCDWDASELPEECRIPVVMDAGPYYGEDVDVEKFRPPVTEWLVPRGYASVQMSLRGTGESGGCLEFKNPTDVEDVGAVIGWLAEQPWSNGNVGMIGRSYDGTSAWAGAASGNPALKAIVPISGAVNGPYLYFKNGTSELRGFINGGTYFPTYATDAVGPEEYPQRLCQGSLVDVHRETAYSALTGDASSEYWQSRDLRPLILERYQGAAWVIHGLEDWNVNPSQAVPFINDMQDAGIETQAWLGVWGHAYPDRIDEHRNVRWDWAERVVRFFDKHLKGMDVDTGPAIEVEDSLFVWRAEESYPPRDATWTPLEFDATGARIDGTTSYTTTFEPFEEAVRIAGLPRVHFEFTPTTATGGSAFAELYDVYPDGRSVRIGWGAIGLRHYDGGNSAAGPLAPGVPQVAKLEMEPVDALVAKGHKLRLVLHKEGVEDIVPSPDPSPVLLGPSTLDLPVIDRPNVVPTYVPPRVG